jgi:hypothetical protein
MAIDVGELLVSIKADLTDLKKGLEDANKKVGEFGAGTVAKGALIADALKTAGKFVMQFGLDSLKAFGESQAAAAKFELALRNTGQEVKQNSKDFQEYATGLQKVTTFTDEAIVETGAMLTNFGLAGDELKSTTKAALDLAKGLGVDLRTATMMLGKAAEGEAGTLARYGIIIGDNVPKAKLFDAVLAQVNQKFGGAAQNDLNNINGKMENFANRVNDAQEQIGKFLLPAFDFWADKAEVLIGLMDRLMGANEKEARGRELTIKTLKEQSAEIIGQARLRAQAHDGIVRLSAAEQERLTLITRAINMEQEKLEAETKVGEKSVAGARSRARQLKRIEDTEQRERDKKLAEELRDVDKQTAAIMAKHASRASVLVALQNKFSLDQSSILMATLTDQEIMEALNHAKRLEELGKTKEAEAILLATFRDAEQAANDAELEGAKRRNAERAQNFQSTLSFIASLAQEKNRTLAAIGKAAAVSTATIDTFAAGSKALASAPPPFNFALMGAVIAAGMANVARIVGVKLARGGVVEATQGGTQAIIGEGGSAEAVLPLEGDRSKKLLGAALKAAGGGKSLTLHFNISGQFIEGSSAKFQRMLRQVIIPEVRRYSEVSPQSSFIRRRGQS